MNTTMEQNSVGRQRNHKFFRFILLLFAMYSSVLYSQTNKVKVTGTVTDEAGKGLPGVTISVNSSALATSDAEGKYSISAPANSTLTFSYVGFTPAKYKIGNSDVVVNITLASLSKEMDQVVVVGYGTQKKKDVTGAVVSVSEKALKEVPVANLQQALQGRAAGLEAQSTSTSPGAGTQIRVRGVRTINGSSDPLIILDGIPYDGSLSDINPNDIASVDILKDASATVIYGSRGSNGVILLTTKRGKAGVARVTYNGYYGLGNVSFKYPVYNPDEYKALRGIGTYSSGYMPVEKIGMAEGRTTNWQDLMYKTAHKTDNNITVSGGSENGATYSLSAGYYKEDAVLPGQDYTRYSVRGTIDSRIGKRVKVGLNTMNSIAVTNGGQFVKYGLMFPILSMSPLSVPDTNGVMILSPAGNPNDGLTYNPLLAKTNNNNWVDRTTRLRTFNSLYAEYEILQGLKYRFNLGLNYTHQEDNQFKGRDLPGSDIRDVHNYFNAGKASWAYVNNTPGWGYTVENLLYYDKTIREKHRINFTGLYSIQESHSHNTSVSKDSIDQDFIQFHNLGMSSPTNAAVVKGGEVSWALISYMARANYAFNDRYMLTVTYRRDGSSRLPAGHKWHDYLAASAGWNIMNEDFMQNVEGISALKLRAGFGQTSNQSINPYESLGSVSTTAYLSQNKSTTYMYNFGPMKVTGYNLNAIPNKDLDWEYTKTINLGLDFGLIQNRITGSIEYYQQKTYKILYNLPLPYSSGIDHITSNIGNMENRGVEFSLSTINVKSNNNGFTWSTDLNLFFNKNKLTNLGDGSRENTNAQLFVGKSMTSIYDYNKLGIWQTFEGKEALKYNSSPGQLKLEDYNQDGVIDNNDKYVIGNCDAALQGGMTNRFGYKNFDLSIVMYARFGGLLISQIHQPTALYLTNLIGDRNQMAVDYWTPMNPTNWFPCPSNTVSPVTGAMSTLGYYNASFVKIRSINLGYTFESKLLKSINAQSARLYASVDNVATLFSPYKKLTGIDPEGTGTGDQSVGGVGNIRSNSNNNYITIGASTPRTRTVLIGLNITF